MFLNTSNRLEILYWSRRGQEWIRTTEGVKPADLQSAPFGRFGTYPDTVTSLAL